MANASIYTGLPLIDWVHQKQYRVISELAAGAHDIILDMDPNARKRQRNGRQLHQLWLQSCTQFE